ncbi:MAG: hypothetical protein NVSMB9_15890 [Isosphaeraceae bacterium]
MATTYTTNTRLQKPGTPDRNWDVPLNANADTLDGMTAIGSLAVTPAEVPSSSLTVRISAGTYIRADGTLNLFAGASSVAVPGSATSYLWLVDSGVLVVGASFPAKAHVRLAQVITGSTAIAQVVDQRVQCAISGTGLGFVLKSGDTIAGPFTVATPGSGFPILTIDPNSRGIGFFGAVPNSQAPPLPPLVDNTTGTATNTLATVGTSFSASVLNNNFAGLTAQVNALTAALKRHGLMSG